MQEAIQLVPSDRAESLDFPWGGLVWYASGALGNGADAVTVGRCLLKPGCSNPRHYHPNCAEILVVTQGRIRHTLSDKTETEMGPGDTVTIPANAWHQATNIGDTDALLFIVFTSPDRKTIGE